MWGAVGTQMPSKGKTESSASGVRLVSVQSRQGGFWRPDISDLGFEGLEGLNGGAGALRGLQADGMGQVTVDLSSVGRRQEQGDSRAVGCGQAFQGFEGQDEEYGLLPPH